MNQEIIKLAKKVGKCLKKQHLYLVCAESCTGGLLAGAITAIAGSSEYFDRGFVVYSNLAKTEELGVKKRTLAKFGAISEKTAEEMAHGALKHSHAKIAIAITGIAGPSGGSRTKPVGTVSFSVISLANSPKNVTMRFGGNRDAVRAQAVKFALDWLLKELL